MGLTMTDGEDATSFILGDSPSHLLHRAQQLAADWFLRNAGQKGVTLRQFAVLAAIAEREEQTQTDLVVATGVDRSTLADMISRMEKRGWVKRKTAKSDARAKWVSLTATGRRTLAAATPIAKRADQKMLDALGVRQRESFIRMLRDLAEKARQEEQAVAEDAGKQKKADKKKKAEKAGKSGKSGKALKSDNPPKAQTVTSAKAKKESAKPSKGKKAARKGAEA